MTTNDESPRHEAALFTSIRGWGITRGEHGVLGGVVEGVGERIGLARVPARIIAVVLALVTSGLFLAAYAAAWALLPDRSGRIIIQDFGRGTPNVGALIGIAILTLIGTDALGGNHWSNVGYGDSFPFGLLWAMIPLAILVGVVVLIVALASRTSKNSHTAGDASVPPVYAVPPKRASGAAAPGSATFATTLPADSSATASDGAPPVASEPRATPSTPPPPPRPRTPGPGSAIYLLTLSTGVLAAAAIWLLDREGRLDASPVVAWLAVAVVIIGGGIVLAGATGRRIGFLGFLAWIFVIGWIIGLQLPRAFSFADGGATITIEGVTHTIGNGHGWFEQDADGVACTSYSLSQGEITDATRYVVEPGQTAVTVTSGTAVVVVPKDASIRFRSEGIVDGSLSIESRNVTCALNRAQGDLYSILRTGDTVTVNIASPDAVIAIEGN